MSFFSIILLSFIQGITEFLPVSSSAHLMLARLCLGVKNNGAFVDVAAHLGSLLAVVWYYRVDVCRIVKNLVILKWTNPYAVLGLKIFVAVLPIVFIGAFMVFVGWEIKNPCIIIYTSIVAGVFLWGADFFGKKKREFSKVSFVDALFIGLGQVFSAIPGVSRSGSTVTAGLMLGFDRKSALKFSFMLAIPTVLLAFLAGIVRVVNNGESIMWGDACAIVLFSAVFSVVSINVMMRFVHKCSFKWFGIYRILLGILLYFILAK